MKLSQEEKLKKIIERAVENGYSRKINVGGLLNFGGEYGLLFSHEFAKAFWGEEMATKGDCDHIYGENEVHTCEENDNDIPMFSTGSIAWKLHLQQAVLVENPIDYYFEHLTPRKGEEKI